MNKKCLIFPKSYAIELIFKEVVSINLGSIIKILDDIKLVAMRFSPFYIMSFLDTTRLRNLLNSYLARRYGKILFEPIRPVTVFIEVVRGCNFSCIMCPANELKLKYMTLDTFKKVLEEFKDALFIYPLGIGEPFLNPEIYEMLKFASERFIVTVFTNLSKMDPVKLVESGVREVFFSIDSANPDEFSSIRRNGNFSVFKKNLEGIIELKEKRKLKYPELGFSITLMESNTDGLENIIEFGLSYGIKKFYLQTVFKADFVSPPVSIPTKSQVEKVNYLKAKYKGRAKILLSSHYDYEKGDFFTGYCLFAYTSIFVDVEGKIFPCTCGGSPSKRDEYIGELFNVKEAIDKRNKFIKNFRKGIPEYCKGCPIYFRNF